MFQNLKNSIIAWEIFDLINDTLRKNSKVGENKIGGQIYYNDFYFLYVVSNFPKKLKWLARLANFLYFKWYLD